MEIVYDYARLQEEMRHFQKNFKVGNIGKSCENRDIPYVFMGKMAAPQVVIVGSIHSREYITTSLICLQMQHFSRMAERANYGVWFLPMLNVDGVELCLSGLDSVSLASTRQKLYTLNGNSSDFSLYKANINGVDLNNNFPAKWGEDKGARVVPSPSGYIGKYPASEMETRAVMQFILQVKPTALLCYHTKGEVIYWDFNLSGEKRKEHFSRGKILSRSTGYPLIENGASVGGLKDWAIESLGVYGYTIEVGRDSLSHPLKSDSLNGIYQKNKNVFSDLEKIISYD